MYVHGDLPFNKCDLVDPAVPVLSDSVLIRILTALEEIKETQKIHASNIQSVMRMLKASDHVPTLPDDIGLPLTEMKAFDDMEAKLQDASFLSAMVLKFVG